MCSDKYNNTNAGRYAKVGIVSHTSDREQRKESTGLKERRLQSSNWGTQNSGWKGRELESCPLKMWKIFVGQNICYPNAQWWESRLQNPSFSLLSSFVCKTSTKTHWCESFIKSHWGSEMQESPKWHWKIQSSWISCVCPRSNFALCPPPLSIANPSRESWKIWFCTRIMGWPNCLIFLLVMICEKPFVCPRELCDTSLK